jgi:hypothetical protein
MLREHERHFVLRGNTDLRELLITEMEVGQFKSFIEKTRMSASRLLKR